MTSWKRGNKNEDEGERLMDKPDLGDKVKGAALKAVGEIEQGVDNVKDKLTGKQESWQGMERKPATRKKSTSTAAAKSSSATAKKSSSSTATKSSGGKSKAAKND